MPTRTSSRPSLAEATRRVTEHAGAIARLEAQLALSEVKRKATKLAGSIVLLVGAGVFGGIAFLLAIGAGVAAVTIVLPVWASLLVVMGFLLLLAGPLGLVGLILLKRGAPPIPEQAIEEARLTTEALKNGRH